LIGKPVSIAFDYVALVCLFDDALYNESVILNPPGTEYDDVAFLHRSYDRC